MSHSVVDEYKKQSKQNNIFNQLKQKRKSIKSQFQSEVGRNLGTDGDENDPNSMLGMN